MKLLAYTVFPTRVGVNRYHRKLQPHSRSIPHTRGGEPTWPIRNWSQVGVFPTRVGVNRVGASLVVHLREYSPHAWG